MGLIKRTGWRNPIEFALSCQPQTHQQSGIMEKSSPGQMLSAFCQLKSIAKGGSALAQKLAWNIPKYQSFLSLGPGGLLRPLGTCPSLLSILGTPQATLDHLQPFFLLVQGLSFPDFPGSWHPELGYHVSDWLISFPKTWLWHRVFKTSCRLHAHTTMSKSGLIFLFYLYSALF